MTDSTSRPRPIGLFATWPRRFLSAAFLAAVAVAVLATIVVRGYEPLTARSPWFPDGWTLEERPDGPVMSVPYVHGATIRHGFALRNEGRWGVTVTGVDADRGHVLARLTAVSIQTDPSVHGGDGGSLIPFEPFALASGEERSLVLDLRFDDCEHYRPGSGNTTVALSVRYAVAGLEKAVALRLPYPIHVISPDAGCPRGDGSA